MRHNKNIRIINIIRIRKEINEHIVIASKSRLTGNELIKEKKKTQLPIIVNKNKEQKVRKYVIVITKSEQEKQVYQIS